MHKVIIKMLLCILTCFTCFGIDGCSIKKDILLEHSVYGGESSAIAENDAEAYDSGKDSENESSMTQQEDLTDDAVIYVYICGEVKSPGVYEMRQRDRVYSLVERAGGLTDQADERTVNQAEMLSDGQMIYIPSVEEAENQPVSQSGTPAAGSSDDSKVNINTAGLEELITLPGIGEGKAQSILSYREEHGAFGSIEEIMNVDGIKEGTYAKMKDRITV